MKPALHLVATPEDELARPTFGVPDYAAIRSRNWARIHTQADKREPFFVPGVRRA